MTLPNKLERENQLQKVVFWPLYTSHSNHTHRDTYTNTHRHTDTVLFYTWMFLIFPIWDLKSYGRYRIFNCIIEYGLKRNTSHSKTSSQLFFLVPWMKDLPNLEPKRTGMRGNFQFILGKYDILLFWITFRKQDILPYKVTFQLQNTRTNTSVNCGKYWIILAALPLNSYQEPQYWAKSYFLLRQIATVCFRVPIPPTREGWNGLLLATLLHTMHSIWQCIYPSLLFITWHQKWNKGNGYNHGMEVK